MREMVVALSRLRAVALAAGVAVIISAVPASSAARSPARQQGRGQKRGGPARAPVKRYVVEGPLSLNLSQCRGELDIPAVSFNGGVLEISGDTVTLTPADGSKLNGRVIAYARSAYYLDSNVSLSFAQTTAPVGSADWKPPRIISLLLVQSRKNPREVIVSPVRGAPTSSVPVRLRCADANAAVK